MDSEYRNCRIALLSDKRVGNRDGPDFLSIFEGLHCKERHIGPRLPKQQSMNRNQASRNLAPIRSASPYKAGEDCTDRSGRDVVDRYCSASALPWDLRSSAKCNVKELLHYLITDNSTARLDCSSDQLRGLSSLPA